ncbi:MAG: FHA domain-containing protein [Roseburia sp.]
MKKRINQVIAVIFFLITVLVWDRLGIQHGWPWMTAAVIAGIAHLLWNAGDLEEREKNKFLSPGKDCGPGEALTELVLLSEEGSGLATWNIYQKNGVVIGRDVGENQVTVNLDQTTYASMVDVEHAVLNYSGNDWYIEDISERNGVSIQKADGRKYKLSYGKPCKLERGDIIFIAMTRLQIV